VESVEAFSSRNHLKVFNLAVGHNEGSLFPLQIIRKYDLHPRLLVLNVDRYFSENLSDYSRYVEEQGKWNARIAFYKNTLSYFLYPWIAQIAPQFIQGNSADFVYRVPENGVWINSSFPETRFPVNDAVLEHPVPAEEIRVGKEFLLEMRSRGTKVIFTWIPGPHASGLTQLSQALGAESIAPRLSGLQTFDGSHLDPTSAKRFSGAFWSELEAKFKDR
jgi:hypothetical protein